LLFLARHRRVHQFDPENSVNDIATMRRTPSSYRKRYAPGDLVQLLDGSPHMRVVSIRKKNRHVLCVWHELNCKSKGCFSPTVLRPVTEGKSLAPLRFNLLALAA